MMPAPLRRTLLAPLWLAQLPTGAKSFVDNPILGSSWLNAHGLHVRRIRLAHRLAAFRRARLAPLVSAEDREAFARDGFVMRRDFLPAPLFAALLEEIRAYRGRARETVQGDTVTRRIALDPAALAALPAARVLLGLPEWRGLVRYVGSAADEPINYIQTILTHRRPAPPDPQCALHADTFHPTVKAWLFLTDVAADGAPLRYVPGSHRMTPARLDWERRKSLVAARSPDRLTARGSFRIAEAELPALGLPPPRDFTVPANTLVVADTCGFHARGPSKGPVTRVEIWAYGRGNPFLPWAGLDLCGRLGIDGWRAPWYWAVSDGLERAGLQKSVWKSGGERGAFDP